MKTLNVCGTFVARGADLLDKYIPGWEYRIDLETLDLQSNEKCVLAQLFGDAESGVKAMGIGLDWYRFGFDSNRRFDSPSFDQLDCQWQSLIRARRGAAGEIHSLIERCKALVPTDATA